MNIIYILYLLDHLKFFLLLFLILTCSYLIWEVFKAKFRIQVEFTGSGSELRLNGSGPAL